MDSPNTTAPHPGNLLTADMILAHYFPHSRRTFYRRLKARQFPAATVRIGRQIRLWDREVIEAWLGGTAPI